MMQFRMNYVNLLIFEGNGILKKFKGERVRIPTCRGILFLKNHRIRKGAIK